MKLNKYKIIGLSVAVVLLIFALIMKNTDIFGTTATFGILAAGFWILFATELISYRQLKRENPDSKGYEKLNDVIRTICIGVLAFVITAATLLSIKI